MANYVIDINSLIECCDFLTVGKINGSDYTYTQNVKALIQRFPKYKIEEDINIKLTSTMKVDV